MHRTRSGGRVRRGSGRSTGCGTDQSGCRGTRGGAVPPRRTSRDRAPVRRRPRACHAGRPAPCPRACSRRPARCRVRTTRRVPRRCRVPRGSRGRLPRRHLRSAFDGRTTPPVDSRGEGAPDRRCVPHPRGGDRASVRDRPVSPASRGPPGTPTGGGSSGSRSRSRARRRRSSDRSPSAARRTSTVASRRGTGRPR